jgi:tRNA (guanine37-N1)-methyltransferase
MPHRPPPSDDPAWAATVITLCPEVFPGPLSASLAGQALSAGIWSLRTIAIRDFGIGRHRQVDDHPAGGGAGMVLRADVIAAAIDHARDTGASGPGIVLTPRGRPLTQARVQALVSGPGVLLIAGRFEGLDQRVIEARGLEEVSIGDYVLSGGDLAAMVLVDACVRLLPGVLGCAGSLATETFEDGLLEYAQYTRPRDWEGHAIPDVLLSGNHAEIERWRQRERERVTAERRPDLWGQRKP